MHLLRSQNLSSLRRRQTASFSTSRTNFASHLRNWIDVLLDDGRHRPAAGAQLPQVDGVAAVDEGERTDHRARLEAKRCSSSRSASMVTSRSSMIGSLSSCSSKVFCRVSPMVCLVM